MGYFAKIDKNGVVLQVISINNSVLNEPYLSFPETEKHGQQFINNVLGLSGTWLQTSYNASFRGKYAGIDDIWDGNNFITPVVE